MTNHPIARQRTAAVSVLAALAAVAGVIAAVDVLRYLGLLPWGMHFFGVSWLGAILSGIVALIWFSVARQLWNLDPRGWMFMVFIAILNLILLSLAIVGSTTFQAVALNFFVSALALLLAWLPSTKTAFGQ